MSGPGVYGKWAVMERPRAGHARPLQGGGVFVGQFGQGAAKPLRPRRLGQLPTCGEVGKRSDARKGSARSRA